MVEKKIKKSDYFTPTRNLIRWIHPDYISKKTPRISPAAFERKILKGKREPYLSVNCQNLESLDKITKYFFLQFDISKNSRVHYVSQKIDKINKTVAKCKSGFLKYETDSKSFCFLDEHGKSMPGYGHYPKTKTPTSHESYSHAGIMFLSGLSEEEEKAWQMQFALSVKPENSKY
jgi:hypothetical protein